MSDIIKKYYEVCPCFADIFWKKMFFDTEPLILEAVEEISHTPAGLDFLEELYTQTENLTEFDAYYFLAMCIGFLEITGIYEVAVQVGNERHIVVYFGSFSGCYDVCYDCHGWWKSNDRWYDEPISMAKLEKHINKYYPG